MRTRHVFLIPATLATLLFACGPEPVPDNDTIDEARAVTMGRGLAASVEGLVDYYSLDFGSEALLLAKSRSPVSTSQRLLDRLSPVHRPDGDGACVTFEGDASDADLDGIPLEVLATFDCHYADDEATASLVGTEYVKDTRPTQAAFDFQLAADLAFDAEGPEGTASATEQGLVIAAENGPLYALDAARHVTADVANENEAHSFEAGEELRSSLNLATLNVSVNGGWEATVDDVHAGAYLATVPFVHVNPMCQTDSQIDGGAVEAAWTNGTEAARLRVQWIDCGKVRIWFNGVIIDDEA